MDVTDGRMACGSNRDVMAGNKSPRASIGTHEGIEAAELGVQP